MQIGWIGLGHMGIPMATNLLKAGYPLTVYNRTPEKAAPLTELGAHLAESPAAVMERCDVIFTMVSDDQAVEQVYHGPDGLLARPAPGKIAVDMSTVSPETSRALAARCQERSVAFLDAPVSGSVQPARDGQLVILVGGDEAAFQKVKPLFDVLGKMALHLGETGSGSKAKLAINLLLGITVQGIAEAVLFAREQGIAPEQMMTIINESAVGTGISRGKTGAILAGEFPAAFPLKHMAKDLRLVRQTGASFPLAESVYGSYQAALQDGLGDEDVMAIIRFLSGETKG